MSQGPYYIGVDVGTGSVRAGLVKPDGTIVASYTEETTTWRDPEDHRIFEQSTNNIWDGMCKCIKACLQEAKVSPSEVKGLGFDATCSLAVSDMDGQPVVVTKGEQLGQNGDRNIILWADHRAEKEAELINSTGSVVLDYVGGTMSVRALILPVCDCTVRVAHLLQHMPTDELVCSRVLSHAYERMGVRPISGSNPLGWRLCTP